MKKILPLILPLLALLAGCLPEPSLSLDKESLSFTTAGGTETVRVTSNYPWTARTSDAWISIQYTEGSDRLTVKAGENPSYDPRTGRITVESLGLSKTLTVTQAQQDKQVLKMTVTGVSSFTVPAMVAPNGLSFNGYLWVGSKQEDYADGKVLSLQPTSKTSIRIEGHNASSVRFDNVEGLTDIDFLEL